MAQLMDEIAGRIRQGVLETSPGTKYPLHDVHTVVAEAESVGRSGNVLLAPDESTRLKRHFVSVASLKPLCGLVFGLEVGPLHPCNGALCCSGLVRRALNCVATTYLVCEDANSSLPHGHNPSTDGCYLGIRFPYVRRRLRL